jgi:hypothetical protein
MAKEKEDIHPSGNLRLHTEVDNLKVLLDSEQVPMSAALEPLEIDPDQFS